MPSLIWKILVCDVLRMKLSEIIKKYMANPENNFIYSLPVFSNNYREIRVPHRNLSWG